MTCYTTQQISDEESNSCVHRREDRKTIVGRSTSVVGGFRWRGNMDLLSKRRAYATNRLTA